MPSMSDIFRTSLHGEVLETLDTAEALYRNIDGMDADELGLTSGEFNLLVEKTRSAYNALCEARYITEADADKVAAMRER